MRLRSGASGRADRIAETAISWDGIPCSQQLPFCLCFFVLSHGILFFLSFYLFFPHFFILIVFFSFLGFSFLWLFFCVLFSFLLFCPLKSYLLNILFLFVFFICVFFSAISYHYSSSLLFAALS